MLTDAHPVIQWLARVDRVWVETALGTPKVYSEHTRFKV
jgi:hypothetical protein